MEGLGNSVQLPEIQGYGYKERAYRPPVDPLQIPGATHISSHPNDMSPTSIPGELLSAVERTRVLPKPAQMSPHLQFMCGPLLRYDTVVGNIWYGAAMIVTADAGSQYSPNPFISLSWDPTVSVKSAPVTDTLGVPPPSPSPSANNRKHQHTRSVDVEPFDPNKLSQPVPPLPGQNDLDLVPPYTEAAGIVNGHARAPSRTRQERKIEGREIWVYHGTSGTFTFWRFMIEVPLSQVEMPVSYSVNNGVSIEFVVPAIGQNMRWAAHSVRDYCVFTSTTFTDSLQSATASVLA